MIRVLAIVCLLLWLPSNDKTITWKETYKLTWNDFIGTPNHDSEAVATTASGITFSYSVKETNGQISSFTVEAIAQFYPDKSWVKPDQADAHVLAHEQLHFDITELHARLFRKQINELTISNKLPQQLDALHLSINKALSEVQKRYDAACDFSRNKEQQQLWQKDIAQQLKALNFFKNN